MRGTRPLTRERLTKSTVRLRRERTKIHLRHGIKPVDHRCVASEMFAQ